MDFARQFARLSLCVPCKILRSSLKTIHRIVFLTLVRVPSISLGITKNGHRLVSVFVMETRGLFLDFARQFARLSLCVPCKILRSSLKTIHRIVFLTLVRVPSISLGITKNGHRLVSVFVMETRGLEPLTSRM